VHLQVVSELRWTLLHLGLEEARAEVAWTELSMRRWWGWQGRSGCRLWRRRGQRGSPLHGALYEARGGRNGYQW
jgi:hypothetical protein